MIRVAVLSDTHISPGISVTLGGESYRTVNSICEALSERLRRPFGGVSAVIHAGDAADGAVFEMLRSFGTVYSVRGNLDIGPYAAELVKTRIITLSGFKIGLTHGWGDHHTLVQRVEAEFRGQELDCIIFGHTHVPYLGQKGKVLYFNPGSLLLPKEGSPPSVGMLYLGNEIRLEHIQIDL